MLLVRICLGPARRGVAGSGGFLFLDVEFILDFEIGIWNFLFGCGLWRRSSWSV